MNEGSIVFQWSASSFFGWGVYGLNLALNARGLPMATACGIEPIELRLDGAKAWVLRDFLRNSRALAGAIAKQQGRVAAPGSLVLHSLGNELKLQALGVNNTSLHGARTVGVLFLEDGRLDRAAIERGAGYDMIVAGSHWNAALLRAHGLDRVETVLQGIDPTLFHPAPRAGLFEGRFAIFSGGKLEYRKGQDIVLKAFRQFQRRHPEALLLTAWHSHWSRMGAASIDATGELAPVIFNQEGRIDAPAWAAANGIPSEAVIDLGMVPNAMMGSLLREADVGLFPNRCEGGTNLVAMELMACGVPAVLSANTGHLDLIGPDNCYALERQPLRGASAIPGREAWGESDPEEIDQVLEAIYTDRAVARTRAATGAAGMAELTWKRQIATLLATLGMTPA